MDCSSGGTGRPRGVAETLTSNRTGSDTATPPDTHRGGDFAGTLTGAPVLGPPPPPQIGLHELETLLQHLLPGTPVPASRSSPGPAYRDWTTIVCFSCGKFKPVHGVGRCPELDETFPYMLPGWSVEKVGANYLA